MENFFRELITWLSFPEVLKKESLNLLKLKTYLKTLELAKKIKKKNSKNKLNTHVLFSNKIKNLIIKKGLLNFLREGFVQKMFFVHNRFFIFFQLLEILKNQKLNKILKEKNIGNPLPYFLYKKSSGNKIRALYHLLVYEKDKNINSEVYFEVGGGYGLMASIIMDLNLKSKYIIFDTKEVLLLQYYYLKSLGYDVGFDNSKHRIILVSQVSLIKKIFKRFQNKKKFFIANWSFSEMPIKLRNNLLFLIKKSEKFIITFQKKFEFIDNGKYFRKLSANISGSKLLPVKYMNLITNKHYYFIK